MQKADITTYRDKEKDKILCAYIVIIRYHQNKIECVIVVTALTILSHNCNFHCYALQYYLLSAHTIVEILQQNIIGETIIRRFPITIALGITYLLILRYLYFNLLINSLHDFVR